MVNIKNPSFAEGPGLFAFIYDGGGMNEGKECTPPKTKGGVNIS
jgi:hypothetical protein